MSASLGLTYAAYLQLMAQRADQTTDGLPDEAAERIEFTRLNLHRSQRIARTYRISAVLSELLDRIDQPQLWLALTEPWCGDSAQCLPYIAVMAQQNPAIDLRLLLRDDNLDIMDKYLTDGKRGIPVLVAQDAEERQLYQWGPRPVGAQAVFDEGKTAGLQKPQIMEKLHLWYGRDRGRAVEAEFVAVLRQYLRVEPLPEN